MAEERRGEMNLGRLRFSLSFRELLIGVPDWEEERAT